MGWGQRVLIGDVMKKWLARPLFCGVGFFVFRQAGYKRNVGVDRYLDMVDSPTSKRKLAFCLLSCILMCVS